MNTEKRIEKAEFLVKDKVKTTKRTIADLSDEEYTKLLDYGCRLRFFQEGNIDQLPEIDGELKNLLTELFGGEGERLYGDLYQNINYNRTWGHLGTF